MPGVDTLALAAWGLLGFGAIVLALLTALPKTNATAREAWPIFATEILIVGSAVTALWIGGWVLTLAVLALTARVFYEVFAIDSRLSKFAAPLGFGAGGAALCFVLSWLPLVLVFWVLAAGFAACAAALWVRPPMSQDALALLRRLVFPVLPLVLFACAALRQDHGAWLLLAFLFVETFDSYALLGGKLFGRIKAFPVLSPRKTVEGLLIGAGMLMLTAALGAWALGASVSGAVLLALLTGPLAVAGDLSASRLKRISGVKDYPKVLPQQGGVFDIADAWIATGACFVMLSLIGFA